MSLLGNIDSGDLMANGSRRVSKYDLDWKDIESVSDCESCSLGHLKRGFLKENGLQIEVSIIQLCSDMFNDELDRGDLEIMFRFITATLGMTPPHQNLAKFYGSIYFPQPSYVLEVVKGTLGDVLMSQEAAKKLNLSKKLQVAIGIANGMSFLHAQKMLHLNLTIDSVLVSIPRCFSSPEFFPHTPKYYISLPLSLPPPSKLDSGYTPKITGFGLFEILPALKKRHTGAIPEKSYDVYCFGTILYEILSGTRVEMESLIGNTTPRICNFRGYTKKKKNPRLFLLFLSSLMSFVKNYSISSDKGDPEFRLFREPCGKIYAASFSRARLSMLVRVANDKAELRRNMYSLE